ncbi:hypothetical protein ALO_19342 [Acetonema longum DSM 6540]|uniref:Uncharacterized protein n=1 Tax=Acetonema longum DSM 6540 TaxID=1009370 RepID=F7NP27_9FIRM|nr:hypothetical protein ALO_19342 [Acetonema longum DSM 6540]
MVPFFTLAKIKKVSFCEIRPDPAISFILAAVVIAACRMKRVSFVVFIF